MKGVMVLPLPVGPRTHSLSMDQRIHQEERRSATDQILPLTSWSHLLSNIASIVTDTTEMQAEVFTPMGT